MYKKVKEITLTKGDNAVLFNNCVVWISDDMSEILLIIPRNKENTGILLKAEFDFNHNNVSLILPIDWEQINSIKFETPEE